MILAKLKSLLDNLWISTNTNNRTPKIQDVFQVKRVDISQSASDLILLDELTRVVSDNGSGASSKQISTVLMIDLRSYSRDQLILVRNEVERILNTNQVNPFSDNSYEISDITDERDLSDKFIKLFRYQINVKFQQLNFSV